MGLKNTVLTVFVFETVLTEAKDVSSFVPVAIISLERSCEIEEMPELSASV